MVRIITTGSLKGGAGKTTTAHNLSAAFNELGLRVLGVDVDPQGHFTLATGLRLRKGDPNLADAIEDFVNKGYKPHLDAVVRSITPLFDLVPTSIRLTASELDLRRAYESEKVLKKLLAPIAGNYDFVILDTHPSLGILTLNALTAADEVIMPLESEYLASESAELFLDYLDDIRNSGLNPRLRITGILLTQVERANIHKQAVANAREVLGQRAPVFNTIIKSAVRFTESQARGQSVLEYDPKSESAAAYRALAAEVLRG